MKTKIRILTVDGILTSNCYGREEFEGYTRYFVVQILDSDLSLGKSLRGFPGARIFRNMLRQTCGSTLEGNRCISQLFIDPYEEDWDYFHIPFDVISTLKRTGAVFEAPTYVVEEDELRRLERKLPSETLLGNSVYSEKVSKTIITITH
jgi:hypothetical protein